MAAHTTNAQQTSTITRVAWIPGPTMDLAQWAHAGQRLGAMARCGQWGLGDWIRYGEKRFGERYSRPARITGYDPQSLMNMVYVASRFEISRRRENLSWSHHEALTSLTSSEQDYWLDRAAADKLSVSDLRGELRSTRRTAPTHIDLKINGAKSTNDVIVCPECGCEVAIPVESR